jgi:surface antigen
MRIWRAETKACLFGSALMVCSPLLFGQASARAADQFTMTTTMVGPSSGKIVASQQLPNYRLAARGLNTRQVFNRSTAISCVPYARQISGIQVTGNAWQWWGNASGMYARGKQPEAGSVLAFRANGRMRLGHVAVVTTVVNPREVIVDHANWPSTAMRGAIAHNVAVVDVSEANNWSAVRVQLATKPGEFGSVYPTYGFIYNRPDNGVMTASIDHPAPQQLINPVPSDLRPAAERPWHTIEEVAESPNRGPHRIDLRTGAVTE